MAVEPQCLNKAGIGDRSLTSTEMHLFPFLKTPSQEQCTKISVSLGHGRPTLGLPHATGKLRSRQGATLVTGRTSAFRSAKGRFKLSLTENENALSAYLLIHMENLSEAVFCLYSISVYQKYLCVGKYKYINIPTKIDVNICTCRQILISKPESQPQCICCHLLLSPP